MTLRLIVHDGVPYVGFLDVSAWQFDYRNGFVNPQSTPPDYDLAVACGLAGVFHRIGNGAKPDASFPIGYGAALRAGLPMGAYHYAQPNEQSGAAAAHQVDRWLEPYPELVLPVMLDFEAYRGPMLSPEAMKAWLDQFFAYSEALNDGRAAILYAGSAFVRPSTVAGTLAHIDSVQPRYSRNYEEPPVRLAEWESWIRWDRPPIINGTLGDWEAWQFSSSGRWRAYGGQSDAAVDRVDVNIARLEDWWRWLPPVVVPPDPGPIPIPPATPFVATSGEDVSYQVRHREPGWPGELVLNVTASTVVHMQHGDAANVDALVGMVPTISNGKVWVGGKELAPGAAVTFTRAMLVQLLSDPARRHISLAFDATGPLNTGQPFVGAFHDPELARLWATYQY